MKLTESVLRQIIKQELEAVIAEAEAGSEEDIEHWKAQIKKRGSSKKPANFSIIKTQLKDEGKITGDESVEKIMDIWEKTGGLKPGYKKKS